MDIFLGVLFLIICLLLIVVILLQKGRGGGLSAAFGGMGTSAFGTKTGDVFTWVTIVLTALFLLLAVGSTLAFRPRRGTVAAPVFQPPPGAISEEKRVSIFCATLGATIRYTINGTDPDEHAAAYEKPVRVEPGTILKARAYRTNWQASEVTTGAYPKAKPTQLPELGPQPGFPVAPTTTAPAAPPIPASAPATAPAPAGR